MPRYSTVTSIYTGLPGLARTAKHDGIIQQHADRIAGRIRGYVGSRYAVGGWTSTSSTPQQIRDWSDGLTTQLTMRSLYTQEAQNVNEWVNEWAETIMESLELVRSGELKVIDDNGTEVSQAATRSYVHGNRSSYPTVFDVDTVTAWDVDSDLIDDISTNRQ